VFRHPVACHVPKSIDCGADRRANDIRAAYCGDDRAVGQPPGAATNDSRALWRRHPGKYGDRQSGGDMAEHQAIAREASGHRRFESLTSTLLRHEVTEVGARQVECPRVFSELRQRHDVEAGDAMAVVHDDEEGVCSEGHHGHRWSKERTVVLIHRDHDVARSPLERGRTLAGFDLMHFDGEAGMGEPQSSHRWNDDGLDRTCESTDPQVARRPVRDVEKLSLDRVEMIAQVSCPGDEEPRRSGPRFLLPAQ
jgi:hypothetical protein